MWGRKAKKIRTLEFQILRAREDNVLCMERYLDLQHGRFLQRRLYTPSNPWGKGA